MPTGRRRQRSSSRITAAADPASSRSKRTSLLAISAGRSRRTSAAASPALNRISSRAISRPSRAKARKNWVSSARASARSTRRVMALPSSTGGRRTLGITVPGPSVTTVSVPNLAKPWAKASAAPWSSPSDNQTTWALRSWGRRPWSIASRVVTWSDGQGRGCRVWANSWAWRGVNTCTLSVPAPAGGAAVVTIVTGRPSRAA